MPQTTSPSHHWSRSASNAVLCGELLGLEQPGSSVYIGLFPTRFARGRPATGQLLQGTTSFFFLNLPNGAFTLLAPVLPPQEGLIDHLRIDRRILVGVGEAPVVVKTGRPATSGFARLARSIPRFWWRYPRLS